MVLIYSQIYGRVGGGVKHGIQGDPIGISNRSVLFEIPESYYSVEH